MGQRFKVPKIFTKSGHALLGAYANVARHLFGTYGFDRVRRSCAARVDTFVHGIGESTDVVRKEDVPAFFSGTTCDDLLAARSNESV